MIRMKKCPKQEEILMKKGKYVFNYLFSLFPIFLGILFIASSFLIIRSNMLGYRYYLPYIISFTLIPGLLLIISRLRKTKNNKIIYLISIIIFLTGYISFLIIGGIGSGTRTYKNISDYKYIYKAYNDWRPELIEHFPKEIPDDVTNVRLLYWTGYLQSSELFTMRYTTEKSEIIKILKKYNLSEKSDTNSLYDKKGVSIGEINRKYSHVIDDSESYEDFLFIILNDKDDEKTEPWSSGYAISLISNEVIYWIKEFED